MNATLPKIAVTSLKIDGYSVTVPAGLSELLADAWVLDRKESKLLDAYRREVIRNDGRFVTVLSKK